MMKQCVRYIPAILMFAANVFGQSRRGRVSSQQPARGSVPAELVQQIIKDNENVRRCIREYEGGQRELLRYLDAKLTDLNNDGQSEYIVHGDDDGKECLRGNRNSSAWIYRRAPRGYELLLTGSNDFKPLNTQTNGYRDVESSVGAGAFEYFTYTYKYNGRAYRSCIIKDYAWQNNRWVLQSTENECQSAQRAVKPRGTNNNAQGLIGLLDNSNYRYLDGCGCYIKPASASRNSNLYFFLAEIVNPNGQRRWMNIDGRVITLNLVGSTEPSKRKRRGSAFTETYRSGDVTARITYVVTSPYRPGGEVEKYSVTIIVTKGNRSQTVKAVGECGC
jgi:hypothetical protein